MKRNYGGLWGLFHQVWHPCVCVVEKEVFSRWPERGQEEVHPSIHHLLLGPEAMRLLLQQRFYQQLKLVSFP